MAGVFVPEIARSLARYVAEVVAEKKQGLTAEAITP